LNDSVADPNVFGALADRSEKYFRRRGVRVLFQEVMLGSPDIVVSELVGQDSLLERILEESVFGIGGPGPGELVLVKTAKFHMSVKT